MLKPTLGGYCELHFTGGETVAPGLSMWGQSQILPGVQVAWTPGKLIKTDWKPQAKQMLPSITEIMRRTVDMTFTLQSFTASYKAKVEFLPQSFVVCG